VTDRAGHLRWRPADIQEWTSDSSNLRVCFRSQHRGRRHRVRAGLRHSRLLRPCHSAHYGLPRRRDFPGAFLTETRLRRHPGATSHRDARSGELPLIGSLGVCRSTRFRLTPPGSKGSDGVRTAHRIPREPPGSSSARHGCVCQERTGNARRWSASKSASTTVPASSRVVGGHVFSGAESGAWQPSSARIRSPSSCRSGSIVRVTASSNRAPSRSQDSAAAAIRCRSESSRPEARSR
jgi:hypothetical protein